MITQIRWEGREPRTLELTEAIEFKGNYYWILTSFAHELIAVEQATDRRAQEWFLANGYPVPSELVPDQVSEMSEAMMRSLSGIKSK